MRTKPIILLLIAGGFGLVASIGMSQLAGRGDSTGEVPTEPIYVATSNVSQGETLTEENVKLEQWPADRIPEGAITTEEELENMVPIQPLFAGEPLLGGKLVDRDKQRSASDRIKPGHQLVSIKVTMESAVSHLILPGDHVDILAINEERGNAETALSNIEVFAINEQTRRVVEEDGSSMQAKTVSLQVNPDQAKTLAFFANSNRTKLQLALRSKDDDNLTSDTSSSSVKVDPLLALRQQLPVQPIDDNSFKMMVVGGDGKVQEFTWDDAQSEELPNEVINGTASSFGGNGGSAGSGSSSSSSSSSSNGGLPPFQGGPTDSGNDGDGGDGPSESDSEAARSDSVFTF